MKAKIHFQLFIRLSVDFSEYFDDLLTPIVVQICKQSGICRAPKHNNLTNLAFV